MKVSQVLFKLGFHLSHLILFPFMGVGLLRSIFGKKGRFLVLGVRVLRMKCLVKIHLQLRYPAAMERVQIL